MRHLLLLLFFSAFLYNVSSLNSDGLTLLSLMKHWKSVPPPINSSWNAFDSTPCSWVGIRCNQAHHVVFINLTGYPMSGQLGPEVGHLSHLQTLVFALDGLSGKIPAELGNCTNLEFLDLSENSLTGKVPYSLKNLQKLRKLILYSNMLVGEILESLFQIPHLEHVLLYGNNLTGPIPKNVGNLTKLSWLHLQRNNLSSTIPSSIGNCTNLKELYLYKNQLQGLLPESLNNLENLVELYLSDNHFQGPIPLGSGKCQNLSVLDLANNSFSGGIPSTLENCKSLSFLLLQNNKLRGEIPNELGKLSELQLLDLTSNHLTGEIPLSIWKISSLEEIYVGDNSLSGELPTEMADLKYLKNIYLNDNQLSGIIPYTLGIKSSLELWDFTNNKFTGNIPPNLCYGKQLVLLVMGQNQLQGSLPPDLGRCPTLERLTFRENNLSGTLPEFEMATHLFFIDISKNKISGEIPSSLGNCTNLIDVNLSKNKLGGEIPSELGRLVNLTRVNFSDNNFKGRLPPQLSNCIKMVYFDVGFNSLNGSFPPSLRSWTELESLILRENQFSGGIPDSLSEFEKLYELVIGGNLFGGKIPKSIGFLQNLNYELNLSANGLVGEIPLEIMKLKMLQKLDLSLNKLTGSINVLEELSSLNEINLSYNSFYGPIPQLMMKFVHSSQSSFLGNPELCVSCLPSDGLNCYRNSILKPCIDKSTSQKSPSKIKIVIISLGSSLFLVAIFLGLLYMLLQRRLKYSRRSSSILKKVMKATENLNDQYIIGRGANGVVYKVNFSPEKIFALKKLEFAENERQNQSMINEIQTLAKIKHRNLVKLKNFWLRKGYGLILYNYMENGSLHDVLDEVNSSHSLKWHIRYKIAVGIAHGLSYLHHDCDPVIVHRDIKPRNILLDSEMEPHIADFGISKLLDHSSTSTSSVFVPGTIGYIAPENAYTTVKSTKTDVYSYGIVLLELLTRKEVLDSSFLESKDMVGWVKNVWERTKDIAEIVDPGLDKELALNLNLKEEVKQVLSVALRCIENDPMRRPTMRDVVKQLIVK